MKRRDSHRGMDAKIDGVEAAEFNPYTGAADRIRAGANEIDDEKQIGYVDPEVLKAREEKARQEKLAQQQQAQQAMEDFRNEERDRTPVSAPKTWLQNLSDNVNPLLQKIPNYWNDFTSNITASSDQKGSLLGSQKYNDALLMFTSAGVLFDQTLFGGKIAGTINRINQSIQNNPALQTAINVVNNSLSFGFGAVSQYLNDMSFGLVENLLHINWENGGTAFQTGRELGRTISTIQGIVEFFTGAATAAFSLLSMPPTGGVAIACGAATGGVCLSVGGIALTLEGTGVIAGSALAGHGVGLELYNNHNQIRGNGGGNLPPNPQKGFFRTNAQNTGTNSDRLYKNMGSPKRLDGYQAHHIVPSFSGRPAAVKARQILEEFGVDINNAGNGVMIPGNVNRSLNKPAYEEAILNALEYEKRKGATQADILDLLQDIGDQIESTGKYP
jgi:hypothetical protein